VLLNYKYLYIYIFF